MKVAKEKEKTKQHINLYISVKHQIIVPGLYFVYEVPSRFSCQNEISKLP